MTEEKTCGNCNNGTRSICGYRQVPTGAVYCETCEMSQVGGMKGVALMSKWTKESSLRLAYRPNKDCQLLVDAAKPSKDAIWVSPPITGYASKYAALEVLLKTHESKIVECAKACGPISFDWSDVYANTYQYTHI